jgi:hypothetical protein
MYDRRVKIPVSMNKERLKLIVKNMELLVQSFKDELELELEETKDYNDQEIVYNIDDYDEIYYDDNE